MNNLTLLHNKLFFLLNSLTHHSSILNDVIYFIAQRLDNYVILLGVLFVIIHRHQHTGNKPRLISYRALLEGAYVLVTIYFAWGISHVLKYIFSSPRPFLYFSNFTPLFLYGGMDSFPSGHATMFAALATSLWCYHRKVGMIFIVFAILISLARVIAGIHFPIDIIAGWIIGGSVSLLVCRYSLIKNKQ